MITENEYGALIVKLAELRGWSESHAARLTSGAGDTVNRIRGGMGLTIRRANAIIENCASQWPEEALDQWPENIPFPDLTDRKVAI